MWVARVDLYHTRHHGQIFGSLGHASSWSIEALVGELMTFTGESCRHFGSCESDVPGAAVINEDDMLFFLYLIMVGNKCTFAPIREPQLNLAHLENLFDLICTTL